MYLGELAWDRGDDERFLELSRAAVSPGQSDGSVSPFSADPRSSQQMLARLIETFWGRGAGGEVLEIVRQAVGAGFAGPGAANPDPWLEVLCRRAMSLEEDEAQPENPAE